MKRLLQWGVAISLLCYAGQAQAFCGFYVAKADSKLFNEASKVVLVRNEDKTVITMVNDYQGDLKEFAMVVPVPTFIKEKQIHVTENAIVEHLDAYTSPRLVEYFDNNPCQNMMYMKSARGAPMAMMAMEDSAGGSGAAALGVTIEAEYTVGEYDILILSAKESDGLTTWLTQNGYKIPDGAEKVLESYIKQDTRFFVAKVNLEEQAKTGRTYLRPLQVAFESPKFMLPIRLGTVNAKGTQELFIYTLTKNGRVETTNYRTVKIPTGDDVPLFVRDEFANFYRDMFEEQVKKEDMRAVFMEYAWDMSWCDPCAADPLTAEELRELGVFWQPVNKQAKPLNNSRVRQPQIMPIPQPAPQDVFVTRLHLRYDAEHFPEDLVFQETEDKTNFQGRYVLRHPWTGDDKCEAADSYFAELPKQFEKQAATLANMTGWKVADIRQKMEKNGQSFKNPRPVDDREWYEKLWE